MLQTSFAFGKSLLKSSAQIIYSIKIDGCKEKAQESVWIQSTFNAESVCFESDKIPWAACEQAFKKIDAAQRKISRGDIGV